MNGLAERRTLPVRGWFALAAVTTFVMIVVVVLAAVWVFGVADTDAAARIDDAQVVLSAGSDRWSDPAWQAAASDELRAEGVAFVLLDGGEEVARGGAPASPDEQGDGERGGDRVTRTITIPGAEPGITAELSTPVDGDDPLAGILRATVVIGAIAAGISFAFGRLFIRPLRAVRGAARAVTEGDMTVELPRSRITEIDEVITAFEEMAAELDQSLEQQAELERERRLFIGAIAHDLRTPLFSLRGYLEGLETGVASSPEQRARYLSIANEKARTLERLVADLFDYTRLEYLDTALHTEQLDLVELLTDLLEGLGPQADEQRLALELLPHDHSCPVVADREQLERAVTNLLGNAIRYTPAGGRIEVSCGTAAESVWFTVADTGPGIDAEDLPSIFHPLYRGHLGRETTDGAGLGLAIAQRILVAHGGTLEAANRAEGAVFTATVPADSGRHLADLDSPEPF